MTNVAAQIKKELKAAFPSIKFSAKTDAGNDIAIYIKYTDGPAEVLVKAIAEKYENIHRCAYSHDILRGANTFIFVERIITKEAMSLYIKAIEAEGFTNHNLKDCCEIYHYNQALNKAMLEVAV